MRSCLRTQIDSHNPGQSPIQPTHKSNMLGRCKGLLLPIHRLYTSVGHGEAQKLEQLPAALAEAKAAMEAALEHMYYLRESAHQVNAQLVVPNTTRLASC